MKRQKILIDTDIGDDIDDVLAIALGMNLPQAEIVGVTTVFGDTVMRARLAKKLLAEYGGYGVPVYAGYADALAEKREKEPLCQYTPELENPEYAPLNDGEKDFEEKAVDFIIECCEKYGKDLVVLAIGPLTNLAKALQKRPGIFDRASRVVMMGGTFYRHHVEWNIQWDVEAADEVFRGIGNLTVVNWDLTSTVQLSEAQTEALLNYRGGGAAGYCADVVRLWYREKQYRPILHDPLAMYCCVDDQTVTFERIKVKVVTAGEARGMTLNLNAMLRDGEAPHIPEVSVGKSVEGEKFTELFLKQVFGL